MLEEFYPTKVKKQNPDEHFNSSLSRELTVLFVEKPKTPVADKWRIRLRILLLQVGGGMTRVIINDKQIWRIVAYADRHLCLQDRLLIRLLLTRGLRTGEICTLEAKNINWETGSITVFDSKKKVPFDIPIDLETNVMLDSHLKGRKDGYVFLHRRKQHQYAGMPLSPQSVWELVKRIGEKAGVEHFNPRMFRRHLSAFWLQKAHGNLAELQVILRHKHPQVTWEYANQFVFEDDIRREADRVTDEMLRRGAAIREKEIQNWET
jgi:integrase